MVTSVTFDPKELESKVKAMYRSVAENPHGEFHFEMGRAMAERLGYSPADLDRHPSRIDRFICRSWPLFALGRPQGGRHRRRPRQRLGHGHFYRRAEGRLARQGDRRRYDGRAARKSGTAA